MIELLMREVPPLDANIKKTAPNEESTKETAPREKPSKEAAPESRSIRIPLKSELLAKNVPQHAPTPYETLHERVATMRNIFNSGAAVDAENVMRASIGLREQVCLDFAT